MDRARVAKDDDLISYCGSFGGESYASTRRRNACTLRQHGSEILSRKLRKQHSNGQPTSPDVSLRPGSATGHRLTIGCHDDYQDADRHDDDDQYGEPIVCNVVGTCGRINKIFHHYRFVVVMLGGFSVGIMMMLRYNITVAILRMVNQTAIYLKEHPNSTLEDFEATGQSAGGEFVWDNEIQQMIMSWYMAAYTLPQFPCTKLGLMIGNRIAVPLSLAICALATLFTPWAAYMGWQWVIMLRLLNGVGAASVIPLMIDLVESWMPYDELSLGLTCAQIFQAFMVCMNPLVSGLLSAIDWKYAFWVPAVGTLAFCVLWLILVSDSPDENWLVSTKELEHICGCPGSKQHKVTDSKSDDSNKNKNNASALSNKLEIAVPPQEPYKPTWLDIFRLPVFYAYMFMWCFYCATYSGFSFVLPAYLRQFLHIPVNVNGLYCSLIQSGVVVSILWPHPLLRVLRNKFGLRETVARRLAEAGLCLAVSFTWIYVGLFHDNQLVMLFINRCFHGSNDIVVTGTLMANFAEAGLSGVVFSIVNSIGNFAVVGGSTFIGYMLDQTGNSSLCWTYIMCGLGVAQIVMMITFVTMVSYEPIKFKPRNSKKQNQPPPPLSQLSASELETVRVVNSALNSPSPGMLRLQSGLQNKSTGQPITTGAVAVDAPYESAWPQPQTATELIAGHNAHTPTTPNITHSSDGERRV